MTTLAELLAQKNQSKLVSEDSKAANTMLASLLAQKLSDKKIADTNIATLPIIAPEKPADIAMPILNGRKPTLLELLNAKTPATNTISSTNLIKEMIIEGKKVTSLAEMLAMKAETQRLAKEAYEADIVDADIESTNSTVPDIGDVKLQTPIVDRVAESLMQKILREKTEKEQAVSHRAETNTEERVIAGDYTTYLDKPTTLVEEAKQEEAKKPFEYSNTHTFSLDIVLNDKQQSAVDFIDSGQSYVLLGAAGTGKTTSERGIAHKILDSGLCHTSSFKISGDLRVDAPSVAFVAFTRRAASNSAKAILKDPALKEQLPHNIMTIHALLEYIPVTYYDEALEKNCFRFEPQRHAGNPLDLTHLIIEEATLVGLDLWEKLYDALPEGVQIIFVGDINQLPPVFGPSILNYALVTIPVIELTQVYRQAEGSPIIDNAHRILRGESLIAGKTSQGSLSIVSGKNPTAVGQAKTAGAVALMFKQYHDMGLYNPEEDIILCPYNKQDLGSTNINTHITEFLSLKSGCIVHEIIAGFAKVYLAVNDKIMYNKMDGIIVEINPNPAYMGKVPQIAGNDLSRFGVRRIGQNGVTIDLDEEHEGEVLDYSNMNVDDVGDVEAERKMQASHLVTVAFENGMTYILKAAGDFNPQVFSLGYALTIHKSQGSEWRRVFILLHKDQLRNLSREMLYTAITRAREEVYLIAKVDVLDKCIKTQRVKGNTLADKIEYFNSGVLEVGDVKVTK